MKRVYVDMVGDLFHYGHMEYLKKARALGDYLLVGIHADAAVAQHKRRPVLSMDERVLSASGCRYVDEVIPNAPWVLDHAFIQQHQIDLVVHGDDYSQDQLNYTHSVAIEMGILRTVPYTRGISTSDLIQRVIAAQRGPSPGRITSKSQVANNLQEHKPAA